MTGRPGSDGEGCTNVSCYQEVEAFTADERYVIFSSDRTGSFQLYRAELSSGELARLSDVPDLKPFAFAIGTDGRHAIFFAGYRVYSVDVTTGEERVLIDFGGVSLEPLPDAPPSFSGSGDRVALQFKIAEDVRAITVGFLATGEHHQVCRWQGKMNHPQICPGDDDLITFVPGPDTQNDMPQPQAKRARTWVCDAKSGETRPFLTMPKGFRATHEFWESAGDRFYFHRKTVPGGARLRSHRSIVMVPTADALRTRPEAGSLVHRLEEHVHCVRRAGGRRERVVPDRSGNGRSRDSVLAQHAVGQYPDESRASVDLRRWKLRGLYVGPVRDVGSVCLPVESVKRHRER